MSNPLADESLPLFEVQRLLDQIVRQSPGVRLLVDMVRDAVTEAARQQTQLQAALRRGQKKRRRLRRQRAELLDALVASGWPCCPGPLLSGAALDEVTSRPALDGGTSGAALDVVATYQRLRDSTLREYAQQLLAVSPRGDLRDFLRLLSERILLRGQRTLAEALLRKPSLVDRLALRARLSDHLLGRLGRHLTRRFGTALDASLRQGLSAFIHDALLLLEGLLHRTDPVLRLLWPQRGSALNSEQQERLGGKPIEPQRRVQAVLFPGLIDRTQQTCLSRALVATRR